MKRLARVGLLVVLTGCAGEVRIDGRVTRDNGAPAVTVNALPGATVLLTCPEGRPRYGQLYGLEAVSKEDGTFVLARKHTSFVTRDCVLDVAHDGFHTRHVIVGDVCQVRDGNTCVAARADVALEALSAPSP